MLIQQPKENKLTTPFDPKPYEITNKKGTIVTARREDKAITRNSTFFKPIRGSVHVTPTTDDSEMENAATGDTTDQQDTTLRKSERERRPPSCLQDYMFVNNMCK